MSPAPPDSPSPVAPAPARRVHVFEAVDFRVTSGANHGDPIGAAAECEPGDVYQLDREARPRRMMLAADGAPAGVQVVASGSELGRAGDRIELVARHVMMAPDGDGVDVLLLRNTGSGRLCILPLSPIAPRMDYTLIETDSAPRDVRLADLVCVAFTTGTMITLAGGAQRPIESLRPGDAILTRDHGAQPLRLVARATLRALGSFAPVVISAGTLGNEGDLIVSPHHRIFLYRRGEQRIGRTAEVLVQAKHLVDGDKVWRREGGYVDYHALVFDRHEIIYAEGIPCESLMVTEATLGLLPGELTAEIRARLPGLNHKPHFSTEAGRETLARVGLDRLFRRRAGD